MLNLTNYGTYVLIQDVKLVKNILLVSAKNALLGLNELKIFRHRRLGPTCSKNVQDQKYLFSNDVTCSNIKLNSESLFADNAVTNVNRLYRGPF